MDRPSGQRDGPLPHLPFSMVTLPSIHKGEGPCLRFHLQSMAIFLGFDRGLERRRRRRRRSQSGANQCSVVEISGLAISSGPGSGLLEDASPRAVWRERDPLWGGEKVREWAGDKVDQERESKERGRLVGKKEQQARLPHEEEVNELEEKEATKALKKGAKKGLKLRVGNHALKRLIAGALAGSVSRTAVAPLETIRTHLMVGAGDHGTTVVGVFKHIMATEGWKGLFRGNFVNVLRVAPSKAIELYMFDTVKKALTPRKGERSRIPFGLPVAPVAGATAGISSTLCTYPLELLKTRLTVQRGHYNNMVDAVVKIVSKEGLGGLYRGLSPSLIGVIPYAACSYYTYDSLKAAYKKVAGEEQVGHVATLLIGSAAGVVASGVTFPLEVARKQMQVGAISGRQVYRTVGDALVGIVREEGMGGLYRGLGASWLKLMPAAGISFMCYEACKRFLIEDEQG